MKALLDTHAFIWWDSDPGRLSASASSFISDPGNEILFSAVSIWEIVIKSQLGKLSLRAPLKDIISEQQANGLLGLMVELNHVLAVETLPTIHKDPFDRLLIAQAVHEGAAVVTADPMFAKYPVRTIW